MQGRMKDPAVIIPDAMKAIQDLNATIFKSGVPASAFALAHLRQPDQRVRFLWGLGGCTPDIAVDFVAAGSAAGCGLERAGR